MKTRLVFEEGRSSKFWEIERRGAAVHVLYGRLGTEGRESVKTFGSAAEAEREHDKLVASKRKKGYADDGAPAGSSKGSPAKKPAAKKNGGTTDDYEAILEEWKAFVAEMKKNPRFSVKARFGKPADDRAIARAVKGRGKAFPEALEALLRVVDGFDVEIAATDPHAEIFADEFEVNPPEHHVWSTTNHAGAGDYKDFLWFDGDDEDEPRRNFLIVDMPQPEFCSGYVLLDAAAKNASPNITFHYCGEEMTRTKRDLVGYLRHSLDETRKVVAKADALIVKRGRSKPSAAQSSGLAGIEASFTIRGVDQKFDGDLKRLLKKGIDPAKVHELQLEAKDPNAALDVDALKDFPSLKRIHISGAPPAIGLGALASLKKLESFGIEFAYPDQVRGKPPYLAGLEGVVVPAVRELYLSGVARIESWDVLAAFPKAEEISLNLGAKAELSHLDVWPRATSIRISGADRLQGIEKTLRLPPRLEELELGSLGLTTIPAFTGAAKLKMLTLWANRISTMKGVEALPALESLNVSANALKKIEGLSALKKLQSLALADNKLSRIEGLEGLTRLVDLELSRNQIAAIDGIAHLRALQRLGLAENKIHSVPSLAAHPALQTLELYGNPLKDTAGIADVAKGCYVRLANCGLNAAQKTALKKAYGKRLTLELAWN